MNGEDEREMKNVRSRILMRLVRMPRADGMEVFAGEERAEIDEEGVLQTRSVPRYVTDDGIILNEADGAQCSVCGGVFAKSSFEKSWFFCNRCGQSVCRAHMADWLSSNPVCEPCARVVVREGFLGVAGFILMLVVLGWLLNLLMNVVL